MCAAEFVCALDAFARHTSSRITFLTLTIVGRSRRDVSSHQDIFQTFGFPDSQDGWLKKRGYNNASINHCFNKASGIDRKDLIQYKEKKTNNKVSFVITYHPALSNLSNIVREHWTTIQKHPELCKIFKEPPVLAFRKPKSLKDILVGADISPRSAYNGQCQKCDSRRCMWMRSFLSIPLALLKQWLMLALL
jgi:hypothetical protein